MAATSDGFAELYPFNKSRLPSGDQMGQRAFVRLGAIRLDGPPATGITQTAPSPGTHRSTAAVPTQCATCEPSGEYTGDFPPRT